MSATYTNILIIDNNDSFTYNIVNILRSFPKTKLKITNYYYILSENLQSYSHIIISPGPGKPTEYQLYYSKILPEIIEKNIPLLGICLGHQIIATFFNATLFNLNKVIHGQNKIITHFNNSLLFKNIPEKFQVGLYHSWAISKVNFPYNSLTISAISTENIIMAIQHKKYNIFGVQFHPESYITHYGEKLLYNFIQLYTKS